MLTIADLDSDLIDATDATAVSPGPAAPLPSDLLDPLVPGSEAAKVLYRVWSGERVTIVDSPPGAGKSSLVALVASHLVAGGEMAIAVVTPTRRQAADIALRIAEKVEPGTVWLAMSDVSPSDAPPGRGADLGPLRTPNFARAGRHTVMVTTIASMRGRKADLDLLIVDEAYQAVYSHVLAAASHAKQVLLVGDPGQIGPVVTVNTAAWQHLPYGPHRRAPEVFADREDALTVNLPCTYRLGAETVRAIAPLYDFEFASARPDRALVGHAEIEAIRLTRHDGHHDLAMLAEVSRAAGRLVGTELVEDGTARSLTQSDVAVVVSHNAQLGVVRAHLAEMGLDRVTVGTADKLQGAQWHAVVALDALAGAQGVDTHSASVGRLCVMASRHRTHLTWLHDGRWRDLLAACEDPDLRERSMRVRDTLCR